MSNKKQGKKQHKTKAERLDEFLYDEDENFDEEDADRVTDDTLEFLSLDDETINRYQSQHKAGTTHKKKKPAVKYRQEYEYEDEDYEDEDYEDEDYEDEDYEDEDYEDEDYEDEDYEDEDYEDEDYEDDDYEERRGIARFIKNISALDVIVVLLGIIVLAGACVTGGIYVNAKAVEKQVEAFATLGEEMEGITVIGEGGLVAVSESAKIAGMIGYESEPGQQWSEDGSSPAQETNKKIEVGLNITSIQSDMKIKFVNKGTGKLIGGVPFEVSVSGNNKNYDMKDDDKDGIIYETGVANGTYSVTVKPLAGELAEKYTIPASAGSVTVTDKIAYKKVEVADEIKTEAEVNAAAEDTEIQTTTESTLTDTVEWVESTKTPVNSDDNYQEVNRADVPDPATLSLGNAVFMKFVNEGDPSTPLDTTETSTSSTTTETPPAPSTSSTTTETPPAPPTSTGTTETPPAPPTSSGSTETPTYSVSISPAEIMVGEMASLSVSGGGYQLVSWESSDSSVASVDNGVVTGIGAGMATITATVTASDGSTQRPSCTVTVKAAAVVDPPKEPTAQEKLNALAPSLSNFTMKKGESTTISVGVKTTQYSYKTSWSSNTASVATIDSNGTVKAVGSGTATISAVVDVDGVTTTVSCIVTVQDTAPVYTLSDITGTTTIQAGGTSQLSVTVTPAGGKVTWSSSDTKIVTVDANGKVTGVAAGSAKIKAECGGAVKECTVTVTNIKYQITITGNNTVQVGKWDASLKAAVTPAGGKVIWSSDNRKILVIDSDSGAMQGVAVGTANVIATCGDSKATFKVTVKNDRSDDTKTKLKDKNGNQLFVKKDGKYVEAVYADYYTGDKLYLQKTQNYTYTGWQTIDGYTYFFDKNGNYVTGDQVIQGARYSFGSDGRMSTGSGSMGIDVSKHNGAIDWNAVKNSGISFVIIRCGYRGSATGALIEDPIFRSNIQGAKAAGLKVGIYVYSQAVNEVEAVEEASMAVSLAGGYGLNYPIFIDVEASGGRGDSIGRDTRTAVCKAFCNTVQNSGYTAGIYSNKNWLSEKINTGSLTSYKIWLAQYAGAPTYTTTKYDMWQYSSKGKVSGISGNVDMNISYLNY